jgi:hypothetical protein
MIESAGCGMMRTTTLKTPKMIKNHSTSADFGSKFQCLEDPQTGAHPPSSYGSKL